MILEPDDEQEDVGGQEDFGEEDIDSMVDAGAPETGPETWVATRV